MNSLRRPLQRLDHGFLIVAMICLIALWPFLSHPGLPQETDAELHVFRLHELSYLVRNGEILPRWAPNFYHGYGYPIFNYYAPLTYYLGLGVELWPWFDAVDGVKAVFILGVLAAAFGVYGFARDNWGRRAGYVAAAAMVYSPYIQYIDPHARGVLAESFSFGLFPLALWALDRLRRERKAGKWLWAILLTAAVILTHNLMGLLFFGLLVAWAFWQVLMGWIEDRSKNESFSKSFLPLFIALLLGLGVAAFFWLPVFLERNAVNLNTLIGQGDNYDFRTHFLNLSELLAFSKRFDWAATEPAFRFNLGAAQWTTAALGLVLLLGRRVKHGFHLLFFAISAAVLLFLMLPISTFVWENLPGLPFFQFPWRLLGATAVMLSILAGAGVDALINISGSAVPSGWRRWLIPDNITAVFVALPILLGLPLSQVPPWPEFGEVTTQRMSEIEHRGRWLGTTSTADFVPATVDIIPGRNGNVVAGIFAGTYPERVNRAPGMIPDGASVITENIRPLKTLYHVTTPEPFRLRLFLFDFPGWKVSIDGQQVETEVGRPEGFIVIPVPAGAHEVEVVFGTTPARTLARNISLVSLFIAGLVLVRAKRSKSGAANQNGRESMERPVLATVLGITAVFLLVLQPQGWLHLESPPYTALTAQEQVFADFGEQIALIGFDASTRRTSPGEVVEIMLYWQAQNPLPINFQDFLHILGPDGIPVAQSDKLNPGEFPTKRWPLDKYVRDEHCLSLPPDLPAGEYRVTTGIWVATEGWRLPLLDETGEQIGDTYLMFNLVVE